MLSARREETIICAKNVIPHVKKLVIGIMRNSPPPRADCAEAGTPAKAQTSNRSRSSVGRRKLSHPCYSVYLHRFFPIPGRNWLAEVSIPFIKNGREFQWQWWNRRIISWLDQVSPCLISSAFLFKILKLTKCRQGLGEGFDFLNTECSKTRMV